MVNTNIQMIYKSCIPYPGFTSLRPYDDLWKYYYFILWFCFVPIPFSIPEAGMDEAKSSQQKQPRWFWALPGLAEDVLIASDGKHSQYTYVYHL